MFEEAFPEGRAQSVKKVEVQEALPYRGGAPSLCAAALSPQTSVALFAGIGGQLWVFRQTEPSRKGGLSACERSPTAALQWGFFDRMGSSAAAKRLSKWFDACDRLPLPEFSACRRMLKNWKPYILNAFDCSYSNAFTEGCSNAIKALKRVVFGFRNFSNFRARILQAANPAHPNF